MNAGSDNEALRVPRNLEQRDQLVELRPVGWEFVLYAGVLLQERAALESKWRDYEFGYARPTGRHLDYQESIQYLVNEAREIDAHMNTVVRIGRSHVVEAAFGPPGEAGDPERIIHLARRLLSVYEDMMDTVARIRGTRVDSRLERLTEITSQLADQPLREIREHVDRAVSEAESIPARLASGERISIKMELLLTMDDRVVRQQDDEIRRLISRYHGGREAVQEYLKSVRPEET